MSDTAALVGAAVAEANSASSAPSSDPSSAPSSSPESGSASETPAAAPATTDTPSADASPAPDPIAQAPTDDSAISPAEKVQGAIPTHRHQAVVTKLRNEHKVALEAKDAELQSLAWAKGDPDAQHKLAAMSLAETDERKFVDVLRRLRPDVYSKLQWADEAPAQPAPVATSVAPAADRPKPDIELEDGRWVYSADAQAKLDEWKEAQYEQRLKGAIDERFRPLDEQDRATKMMTAARDRTRPVVEHFRATKPLFKENEVAIKAAVAANLKDYDAAVKYGKMPPALMSLQDAYIEVVVPMLVANRDQMRKDILAEINARPAPATLRPVAQQPAATGTGGSTASTADLIRLSLAR